MKDTFVISRHMEGITLNEKEYVLEKNGDLMLFDTPGSALDFYYKAGGAVEDINYSVYIDKEEA